MMYHKRARLGIVAFGIAFGVVCALSMMLLAWGAMWGWYGPQIVAQYAPLYPGLAATWQGGLMGGAWGFIEGFIFGVLLAFIYNLCLCCCSRKCCCGSTCKCGTECTCGPECSCKKVM